MYYVVRLTNWLKYIFSVSLTFVAYYITGQWDEFIKFCQLMLSNAFLAFLLLLFLVIKLRFLLFSFLFFWWSIKFTLQNINQLETRIGGFQPSLELYSTRWKQKTLCFVAAKNYYAGYTAQYWFILVIMVWCCCINFRNVNAERGTNSANYLEAVEKCRYS